MATRKAHHRRRTHRKRRARRVQKGAGIATVNIPFFTKAKDSSGPREINGIPLKIYRSWITHDVPLRMKEAVDKTIEMSPEFDQYMYSDEECLRFIEENFEPNVAKAFRSLKPGAYQSDLWRLCILYKLGGIYIDIKLVVKIPVREILNDPAPILVKDYPDVCSKSASFWNGVMAAPPGLAYFKACIDKIVENCKTQTYGENPLAITGPCLMGSIAEPGLYERQKLIFNKDEPTTRRIFFNDREFSEEYIGYREDQAALQKTERYSNMWDNRNVFNTSIKFD